MIPLGPRIVHLVIYGPSTPQSGGQAQREVHDAVMITVTAQMDWPVAMRGSARPGRLSSPSRTRAWNAMQG